MIRLFVLIGIFSAWLMCSAVALAGNDLDAFCASSSDISTVQISPNMRDFLDSVIKKIKSEWQSKNGSVSGSVLATFDLDHNKKWHFYSPKTVKDNANRLIIQKRVEKALSDSKPPINEPFGIVLKFEIYNPDLATVSSKRAHNPIAQPDVDFGPYMALLQSKVQSNWKLRKEPLRTGKTDVVFTVKKDGSVHNAKITKSSGIAEYDKEALEAVNNSSPFLRAPTDGPETFDIQYTFEYEPKQGQTKKGNMLYQISMKQPEVISTSLVNLHSLVDRFWQ